MINTETNYAGLKLKNPLIIGSSGLTNNAARNKEFEKAGVAAIVLKSLFEEQIEMQSDRLLQNSSTIPEAADYIRNYAKAHQIDQYLSLIKDTKSGCTIPIIASINCYKSDAWVEYARQIQEAGADALELNVFYLCTDLNFSFDNVIQLYTSIIQNIKTHISIPIIIKIGKYFSNIPALVNMLKLQGTDGVVLFNRYYQPDININSMQLVSGQVFSSHSDLSDTLRWTALVSGAVPNISIASSSGIHDWEDVIKCMIAGADAVQLCSTVYAHGAEVFSQMLTCIEEWMHQFKYESLSEIKGKLSFSNAENASFYERSQFMKYFSDRD